MFCPEEAIKERDHPVGEIVVANVEGLRGLTYGRLRIGEASASPLIKRVKKEIPEDGLTIIDCPPGTACPAVESMRGSDLCVLVTEPTPFGFHDLKLALAVAKKLKLPHVVLVNKKGLPGPDIERFCEDNKIPVVGDLPLAREIAETYSKGRLLVSEAKYERAFKLLLSRLLEEADLL
jgi:MinD superfamily P-loop ATPase